MKCRFLLSCTPWREGESIPKGWGKARRKHPTWAHAEGALSQEPELRARAGQGRERAFQLSSREHQDWPQPVTQPEKKRKSFVKETLLGLYNSVISGQWSACWLFSQLLVKNNAGPKKVTTMNMAVMRSSSLSLLGRNNLIFGNGSGNCYSVS